MGEKLFIKFVIPCWGIEKTIGRMLDSILSQTFTDYHIVCVEDCSPDKTWQVLQDYKKRFSNKITLIKNPKNFGAGESRNRGVLETQTTIPSDYLWIVDGDDYLADKNVLNDMHAFANSHSNYDIINVGITYCGKYSVGKVGWPIASWGRIIKPCAYVSSPSRNIPHGNDVYAHFVMFDTVEDSHIGEFNRNCYVCPKNGMHRNNTEKNMNVFTTIGEYLMQHDFKKKSVIDSMKSSESGVWKKICDANSKFHPKFQPNIKRNVSILMASFPHRKKWMLQCIERLMPQCDNFYLWLNEYKEIPEELKQFDQNKLHITLGEKNLKENGRYMFLNRPELQDDYCFICDDDINWPKDYVKNTIDCFHRNGDNIVIAYFINGGLNTLHKNDEIKTGYNVYGTIPQYRFGAGTCSFVPSIVNFSYTYDELVAHYDMEMLFGQQCIHKGIKICSPKRLKNWISFIQDGKNQAEIEKYALYRNNIGSRIKKTFDYMKNKHMVKTIKNHQGVVDCRRFWFG